VLALWVLGSKGFSLDVTLGRLDSLSILTLDYLVLGETKTEGATW
jgi:hypothetical protein